ncbi:MAG: hypothetical protein GY814_01580 [Gammaproteobacteria bacterium]|nr:hypothetical protein [Gammaproteobacteria bacterium]
MAAFEWNGWQASNGISGRLGPEYADELQGAFLNYELDLRYRAGKNILLGVGTARLSFDLKSDADDWRGRIADSHRGILLYVGYQI